MAAAAASAAEPRIDDVAFFPTFSMERFDAPSLRGRVDVFVETRDPNIRAMAVDTFVNRFVRGRGLDVRGILFQVLDLVAQMNAVKHDVAQIWNLVQTQATNRYYTGAEYMVFLLQAHCFLLPTLSPAQVRQLEQLAREQAVALRAVDGGEALLHERRVTASNELIRAWSVLFRATRQQRALRAVQLTRRLEEGAAAHLPELPKGVGEHIASFLVPPAFVHEPRPPPNAAQAARQAAYERGINVRAAAQAEEEALAEAFNLMAMKEEEEEKGGAGGVGIDLASAFEAMSLASSSSSSSAPPPSSAVSARWQSVLQKPFTTPALEREVHQLAQYAREHGTEGVRPLARAFFRAHYPHVLSTPGRDTCLAAFCDLLAFYAIRTDPLAVFQHMRHTVTPSASYLPAGPDGIAWSRLLLYIQAQVILVSQRGLDHAFVRQLRDTLDLYLGGFSNYDSLAAAWLEMSHAENESLDEHKRVFERLVPALVPLIRAAGLHLAEPPEPVHPDVARTSPVYPFGVNRSGAVERNLSVIDFSRPCYLPTLRLLARSGLTDPHLLETHARAFFRRHVRSEADRLDMGAAAQQLCVVLRQVVFPLYTLRDSADAAVRHLEETRKKGLEYVAERSWRGRYSDLWIHLQIHCILLPYFSAARLQQFHYAILVYFDRLRRGAYNDRERAMFANNQHGLEQALAPVFEAVEAMEEEEEEAPGAGVSAAAAAEPRRRRLQQNHAEQEKEKQQKRK